MGYQISVATRDDWGEWLRLRKLIYTGVTREFHQEEMELFCGDTGKDCLVSDRGVSQMVAGVR